MRCWPIALPSYDVEGGGVATPDAPAVAPPDDGGSLADHEASYAPGAERRADPEPEPEPASDTTERDETGRFKPRHRAKSQQARAEDAPRIQELTRRLREKEAEIEGFRRATPAVREPHTAPPVREATPPAASPSPRFPNFVEWIAKPENADKEWDDYSDARTEHNYARLREAERVTESQREAERAQRTVMTDYHKSLETFRAETPDFDDVIATLGPHDVSKAVEQAAFRVGPQAVYYLATHPDELRELTADTLLGEDAPGFAATVAATKRYLSTLVASQRSPSTRTAAAPTGSAPAPTRPTAPRPPNPVRTGSIAEPDTPPDPDDQSLASHEKHYGRKSR